MFLSAVQNGGSLTHGLASQRFLRRGRLSDGCGCILNARRRRGSVFRTAVSRVRGQPSGCHWAHLQLEYAMLSWRGSRGIRHLAQYCRRIDPASRSATYFLTTRAF